MLYNAALDNVQVGPFSDADMLPQWAIALIVMGSCITLAIVMVLIAKAMHYYNLIMSPGALSYLPQYPDFCGMVLHLSVRVVRWCSIALIRAP